MKKYIPSKYAVMNFLISIALTLIVIGCSECNR